MSDHTVPWVPTLANKLTLARIAMAAPIVLAHDYGFKMTACLLFGLACISDLLDGAVARWQKQETAWGHLGDPIADKLSCFAAFVVCFAEFAPSISYITSMAVIFGYDALVIWMRTRVAYMPTLRVAKWKTFFLMSAFLAGFIAMGIGVLLRDGWGDSILLLLGYAYLVSLMHVLLIAAALLALVSALQYARTHGKVLLRAPAAAE